ncbi:MAG: Maf family protein [Candidatus Cloacimonas sp.]|jgi:septum formation protein|nr:Maf family protein [Candidatus Cloacimonadota bacterium]
MIHNILRDKQVVLASNSPRRREIFKQIGLNVLHKPAKIKEDIDIKTPRYLVMKLAEIKARSVASEVDPECVVVAADTIVYLDGEILNKPADIYQAADYLSRLSAQIHYVYTGIAVCYRSECHTDFEKTAVTFKELSAQEIGDYIETREPDDKAGAYGIQGYGSQFITKINGCYFNVMGFPVANFYELLAKKVFPPIKK